MDPLINNRKILSQAPVANSKKVLGVMGLLKRVSNSDDALRDFTETEVAAFYRRLAKSFAKEDAESLASELLLHWLDGNGALKTIKADRIKDMPTVKKELMTHRKVFLSQGKAYDDKIKGIVPRIKGEPGFPAWDGVSPIEMQYQGKSFEIVSLLDFELLQAKAKAMALVNQTLTKEDVIRSDLFASLHATSLWSLVKINLKKLSDNEYKATVVNWQSRIQDNYNWDQGKYLTLPNPDYQNPYNIPKPVAPNKRIITIRHHNALRVESAGLAKSFDFTCELWDVTDHSIIRPEILKI